MKGGKGVSEIHKRVAVLGFTLAQVEILASTLAISEAVPPPANAAQPEPEPELRPAPAAVPPLVLSPAPAPAPAPKATPKPAKKAAGAVVDPAKQRKISIQIDVDVYDPFEYYDKDDPEGVELADEWLKKRLTNINIGNLKILLRCGAQHMVGQDLDNRALDTCEAAVLFGGLKRHHAPVRLATLTSVLCTSALLLIHRQHVAAPDEDCLRGRHERRSCFGVSVGRRSC